ncbi:MAG: hypothetical protein DMF74_27910 [Acidobacteria bacterium]|nr:MAG: hypothetical protein DMF74_27910 [Acidobacteriota bacterium]
MNLNYTKKQRRVVPLISSALDREPRINDDGKYITKTALVKAYFLEFGGSEKILQPKTIGLD